jgi:hypothetical protein
MRPSKFRVMVWLCVLLCLTLLYLLSVPPVMVLTTRAAVDRRGPVPDWVLAYSKPCMWLSKYPPLRKPMNSYTAWWFKHYYFKPEPEG